MGVGRRQLKRVCKMRCFLIILSLVSALHAQRSSPPEGQRCSGRNFNGRRCCTPDKLCGLGEGDCDGAGDGGVNDGDRGCRPGLVCGSNNCRKFGAYYHEKDDCCERASGATGQTPVVQSGGSDWGPWSEWTGCSRSGIRTREQRCRGETCSLGNGRVGSVNTQERYCYTKK